MASRNYRVTLRFLCVFVSLRLKIFTAKAQGRKDFAKNPKHIWLNFFMQYFLVSPSVVCFLKVTASDKNNSTFNKTTLNTQVFWHF